MLAVQAGDSAAFETLFGRYERRLYSFLVRRTGDREAAAELFQDTFLKMYRARDTWDPSRPVKPWLFGIAAHAATDRARRRYRRPAPVELEDWDHPSPAHSGQTDARLALERGLSEMPDNLREAFVLGAVQGFDHNEVASSLSISPANARARISRGRSWLRTFLGGDT
jgi:RNA polymerase sigma-70 factor (ECF subfamily)